MTKGDLVAPQFTGYLEEHFSSEARAKKAWILPVLWAVRLRTDIALQHPILKTMLRKEGFHLCCRVGTKAGIHVDRSDPVFNGYSLDSLPEKPQKGHAILPTRDGDEHMIPIVDHLLTVDSFPHQPLHFFGYRVSHILTFTAEPQRALRSRSFLLSAEWAESKKAPMREAWKSG